MSGFGDLLKSGASSIAGAVSEKLGVDPSMAQSLVDKVVPGDEAAAEGQEVAAEAGAEAPAAEEGGLIDQVSSMVGGEGSMMDKAKNLLDQDGDGNPLNDITGMVGKLFGGNK